MILIMSLLIFSKLNNTNIKISISYITNFKPADFLNFKNFKILKNKNSRKIISRNFFLFLLLLKYSNVDTNLNISIFVKPFFKKFITLLRAPYRHKLSRHQFILSRYYVLYTINVNSSKLFIKNIYEITHLLKNIKYFYTWFESNIVYQHQVKIFFNFSFEKFFNMFTHKLI